MDKDEIDLTFNLSYIIVIYILGLIAAVLGVINSWVAWIFFAFVCCNIVTYGIRALIVCAAPKNKSKQKEEKDMNILNEIEELKKRLAELEAEARKQKKTWEFTDDEKVILRNLDKKCQWLARDEDRELCVYNCKPKKADKFPWWVSPDEDEEPVIITGFKHLFQSVKWTDEEPCEFRKFI